jgi:lysophospholipase L1-like esterase
MGFRVNREGFFDVEPETAAQRAHRVVCVGDSFTVGVVPHPDHYTTVAERAFQHLEVFNAGVVNAGPREYLRIVETSAPAIRPELVVVALFLGNDIVDAQRGTPTLLSTWTDRDEILTLQIWRRLRALASERRAGASIADPNGSTATSTLTGTKELTPEEIERNMPWLHDPRLENPPLSAPRFLYVETVRTGILLPDRRDVYEDTFAYLDRIRDAARPARVACLLIPDEYQVEDDLWAEVRAQGGLEAADREQPQKILSTWLEGRGIPFLDLLPRLRAVPPLTDGKRHVYHLRDTHFNARGNRVAGEGLAELIERVGVAKRTDASGGPR